MEEEEERLKKEKLKLDESKQPRHYRMPEQHRLRAYSDNSEGGFNDQRHEGGTGYHGNRYHDNRGVYE